MRIAHLSDLHLGYRAYNRLAPGGINIRERDVARAFRSVVDRVIEADPQLIVIAGDVFHSVRPSNSSIADAFHHLARAATRLPDARIVIIGGDHDTPRSVESGSILRLFREIPNVRVVDQGMEVVQLPELDTNVKAVSHTGMMANPFLKPEGDAQTNILVLHGAHDQDTLGAFHDYSGILFHVSELHPELWDYIALGHYHEFEPIKDNVIYSGAIERTSNNIWKEKGAKGFVLFDTESREVEHIAIETRTVIDLKPISNANQHSSDGLNAEIRKRVEAIRDGVKDKIVRLVIYDLPREMLRDLDHRFIRDCKAQALHFQLDTKRPQTARVVAGDRGRYQTLEQELEAFILHQWHPSNRDVEKTRVLEMARHYLQQAGAAEASEISAFAQETDD